ncbi:hypothetical protein ACLB2K_026872 [Fragaria x ananassa]
MLKSRHCPRLETFGCLVTGLLKCGNVDGACFVLVEMVNRNLELCCAVWEAPVVAACGEDSIAGNRDVDNIVVQKKRKRQRSLKY